MKNFLKSEWKKASRGKGFYLFLLIYVPLLAFLSFTIKPANSLTYYRIFTAFTIFALTVHQILSLGELIEKGIIRYYMEYLTKRFYFISYIYTEYIILYVVANGLFLLLNARYFISNLTVTLVYFLMFLLFLTINCNIALWLKRIGSTFVFSLLLLWILPNLVNFLLNSTSFFSIQIFYYLSPDTFTGFLSLFNLIIPIIYIILLFIFSIWQFIKEEY